MYNCTIDDMAAFLVERGVIGEEKEFKAAEALCRFWEGKIAIVWTRDDVEQVIKQIYEDQKNLVEPKLEIEELDEILDMVFHQHDASIGISWDILRTFAEDYLKANGLLS